MNTWAQPFAPEEAVPCFEGHLQRIGPANEAAKTEAYAAPPLARPLWCSPLILKLERTWLTILCRINAQCAHAARMMQGLHSRRPVGNSEVKLLRDSTTLRMIHSARSMIFGSMREARAMTGNADSSAIANKTNAGPVSMTGSLPFTPYSSVST
jgi:hypothetical protein